MVYIEGSHGIFVLSILAFLSIIVDLLSMEIRPFAIISQGWVEKGGGGSFRSSWSTGNGSFICLFEGAFVFD